MLNDLVRFIAIGTAGVLITSTANAQPADPKSVIHACVAAVNADDVDGVMALFADDVTHTILPTAVATGQSTYAGKTQLRALLQAVVAGTRVSRSSAQ